MIEASYRIKHYSSASHRFFKPVVMDFFAKEFPKAFGPIMREKMADELIELFEKTAPEIQRIKPGQILWNALDKNTRASSPKRRLVSVVLSLITEKDIEELKSGIRMSEIHKSIIARIIREAYNQGGILSSRDVGLLLVKDLPYISNLRIEYEKENNCILPHTGALHDMGSSISHKKIIIRKVVVEKKDPAQTARECNHSQRSVDRYLKDYYRVKTAYEKSNNKEFVHHVTGISKHVVEQYIEIIKNA